MIKLYTFREFKWHTLIIKTVEKEYDTKLSEKKIIISLEYGYLDKIESYLKCLCLEIEKRNSHYVRIMSMLHDEIDFYVIFKVFTFYYFVHNEYCMYFKDMLDISQERYLKIAYYKYLDKFAWEKKGEKENEKEV